MPKRLSLSFQPSTTLCPMILFQFVGDANSTVDETITLANTWDLLLINIRIFSNLVDKVVEVRLSVLV